MMSESEGSRPAPGNWLVCLNGCRRPRLTLLCFPFGGGGAAIFSEWVKALGDDIELWAVRLPGRESREAEDCATDARDVVAGVVRELVGLPDRRMVFYGHSMGAGLAYQVAMALRARGKPIPRLFIASGRPPPHRRSDADGVAGRSDEELLEHVRELGGIPEELLARSDLSIDVPTILADYRLNATIFCGRAPAFAFPITIINGIDDPLVRGSGLDEWRDHTSAGFSSYRVPGGHFCLRTHPDDFLRIVAAQLAAVSVPPALSPAP